MNNNINIFNNLLRESKLFPKDELKEHYLVPAFEFINKVDITNEFLNNKTALQIAVEYAIEENHPIRQNFLNKLIWELIDKFDVKKLNHQDNEGNSIAHKMVLDDDFSVGIMDLLKESGLNYSLTNNNGDTPLILVGGSYSLDTLKYIHAYTNINMINHKNNNNETALYSAIKSKNPNNIFFLLQNGASVLGVYDNKTIEQIVMNKNYGQDISLDSWNEIKDIIKMFLDKETATKKINVLLEKQKKID